MLKSGYVPAILLFQKNEGVHMGDLKKLGANIRSLKLEFLQRYGWLTDDDDVRAYSAKYKPKK